MKIKLILIMLLLASNLVAQTREASRRSFTYKGIPNTYLNSTLGDFNINSFTLGWHWGVDPKLSKALEMNQCDAGKDVSDQPPLNIPSNSNSFLRSMCAHQPVLHTDQAPYSHHQYIYTHCNYDNTIIHGKSMRYDPELTVNSSNLEILIPRDVNADDANPIFGFINYEGIKTDNTSDVNYKRLKVGYSEKDKIVLQNPWPSNKFYYTPKGKNQEDPFIQKHWTGKALYVSINLRRTGTSSLPGSTPVLRIKVPFYFNNGSTLEKRYAYFDTLPNPSVTPPNGGYYSLPDNKGNIWRLKPTKEPDNTPVNEMIITQDMLPATNIDNGDITISAIIDFSRFITIGGVTGAGNKLIKKGSIAETDEIEELKVEVEYIHPDVNMGVAIDWIKFESPNARWLAHGEYDDYIDCAVQESINRYELNQYTSIGAKLSRFILNVEGNETHWGSERVFSKLIGDIFTGEWSVKLPEHHKHYTNLPEEWHGFHKLRPTIMRPFCKSNYEPSDLWKTFGIIHGSTQDIDGNPIAKSLLLNSWYETFLKSGSSVQFLRTSDLATYSSSQNVRFDEGKTSPLAYWEWQLYQNYVDPKMQGYEYSDKAFFSQVFIESDVHLNDVTHNNTTYKMPRTNEGLMTAEDLRLSNWNQLIMGAKGLIYDGDLNTSSFLKLMPDNEELASLGYNSSMTDAQYMNDFFLNKNINPDYFNPEPASYSTFGFKEMYEQIPNSFNDLKNKMGTPQGLFLGRYSQRIELLKIHQFIRANESEIMNLRLQAWYGKGFKIWQSQHPDASPNILSKFLNLTDSKVLTRKIENVDETNGYTPNTGTGSTYEDFVDFTLLKDKNQTMDNVFYIGVSNRRTDPLIYFTEDPNPANWKIIFLSTAELEELCKSSAPSRNPADPTDPTFYGPSVWKKYWWRRLASREVTIPFNYKGTNSNQYNLLKITELDAQFKNGTSLIEDNQLPFHLQSQYHDKVLGKVIGQDGEIKVKLLPGEGRIFRVEVLKPDLNVAGELDHSNQTKFVAFPVYNTLGQETDQVQYHLVYHRTDNAIGKNRVYYRRSNPINKDDSQANIVWQDEILVSKDISLLVTQPPVIFNKDTDLPESIKSCDFPSIVVSKSDNFQYVYIFYTCGPANDNQFYMIKSTYQLVSNTILHRNENQVISNVNGLNRVDWGNPVQNSSKDINFVAWSDAGDNKPGGIVVATYTKMQSGINDTIRIPLNRTNITSSRAMHPSMNTYSISNENSATLTWQQDRYLNSSNFDVYMTRIKNGNLYKPVTYSAPINNRTGGIIYDGDIAKLSSNGNNKMPVVYRKFINPPSSGYYNTQDFIAWENTSQSLFNFKGINIITSRGGSTSPDSELNHYFTQVKNIYATATNLTSPNVAQAQSWQTNGLNIFPTGDVILNYLSTEKSFPVPGIPLPAPSIFHKSLSFFSIFSINNTLSRNANWSERFATNSTQPHLVQFKNANSGQNIWKNRRVFENGTENPPQILTSARFYYKQSDTSEIYDGFVGFENQTVKYMIDPPLINGNPTELHLPFNFVVDTVNGEHYVPNGSDTITSSWFQVASMADLSFKCYGINDTLVKAVIQKMGDTSQINLNLPLLSTDTSYVLGKYTLINGNNDFYRVALINIDTTAEYNEAVFLGGLDKESDYNMKTNSSNNIINLAGKTNVSKLEQNSITISIFPNPADEKLFVTAYLPLEILEENSHKQEEISIKLYDILGVEYYSIKARSGETIEIPISEYANGSYLIKAEYEAKKINPLIPAFERVIISR